MNLGGAREVSLVGLVPTTTAVRATIASGRIRPFSIAPPSVAVARKRTGYGEIDTRKFMSHGTRKSNCMTWLLTDIARIDLKVGTI